MDDFWTYKKRKLEKAEPVPTKIRNFGNWTNVTGKVTCVSDAGQAWTSRDDENCEILWPSSRAGHVAALDRGGMWIFGGYRTYFPYISTDGPGYENGVVSQYHSI